MNMNSAPIPILYLHEQWRTASKVMRRWSRQASEVWVLQKKSLRRQKTRLTRRISLLAYSATPISLSCPPSYAWRRVSGTGARNTWMNTVFSLLFTPVGRYLAMAVIAVVVLSGVYFKIRSDAIAEIEAKATADALRRVENAVRAGDAVDVTPDGLLKSDGHKRD